MNNLFLMAQTQSAKGSMVTTFLMFGLVIVFFYFLMIKPQKKQEKQRNDMIANTQIGDEIMTTGGILGIVVKMTEDTVVIETGGDKSKLRIVKSAIQENVTLNEKLAAEKNEKNKALMEAKQNKKGKNNEK